ncbi:MAG: UvrD-helicase domain-containing protein [Nitrospirae bacterium]|nr:UvrD-helicase domain-containing protein [Nitrospirota bacterium]
MAVTTAEGPVLIVAGPGTGKTLTIVRRIAYLIQQGAKPENILAVTFTNRAAREMEERAEALLGSHANNIFIGTFHLLGLSIIKNTLPDNFVIYNRDEQVSLLKPLLKGSNIKSQEAIEKISRIKNLIEDADDEINKIYAAYQSALNEKAAFDFDDLILKPIEMLSNLPLNIPSPPRGEGDSIFKANSKEAAERYRNIFNYIIVDEYQDINPAQYRLMRFLSNSNGNICAVGDSDQAIYAFRGADITNFLNFEKDFKAVKQITLTENYRSTEVILNASNSMIKNNKNRIEKELCPTRGEGILITLVSAPDDKAEGEFIVKVIEARIGGTSHYQMMRTKETNDFSGESYSFSDFAVIYRTNAQARAIEEAFLASGVPYQVIGRGLSKQSREMEDTISYMKSIIKPSEDIAAPEQASLEEKLLTPADIFDPRADAVTLMTLHMAKGLEFKVVFIAGVEEGLLPYTIKKNNVDPVRSSYIKRACDLHGDLPVTEKASNGVDIEEDRRLFYVGITRAKDELFLIHARERFLYGQRLRQMPSSFLKEMPEPYMQKRLIPDRIKKDNIDKQIGLF